MNELNVSSAAQRQMIDITPQIASCVADAGLRHGWCLVFVPHTTAAVVINENADPDVQHDLLAAYEQLVPAIRFRHAEGNSDAHLLSTLLGASVTVPVSDGALRLGTWQSVFFVELDGPRRRRLWVSLIASAAESVK